jgi:hypothetical protein
LTRRSKKRKPQPVPKEKTGGPGLTSHLEKLGDWGPMLLFFIVTVILFRNFIFSGDMLFGTDTVEAGLMFRSFYAEFVRTYHTIPLWNPYLFGGLPFIDAMHGETFYPLAVLKFLIPVHRALGFKIVITVLLCGIFMYLLLRAMGLSRLVSTFGGVAYLLCSNTVTLTYGGHTGKMYVISLLPLLFLAVEKIFKVKRIVVWYLVFALFVAVLILANHPQLAYFAMWGVGAYYIYRLLANYLGDRNLKRALTHTVLMVLALTLGLAAASVQLVAPYTYLKSHSPRAGEGRGYEFASSWSLHPEEVVDQVVPGFSGYNVWMEQTYWGRNAFKLNSEYGGLIPLVLALIALYVIKDRRKYLFLGISLVALLYALGDNTPFFTIFYHLVPGVKSFRAPSTIMFLLTFSVTVLGAMGLQRLTERLEAKTSDKILKGLIIATGVLVVITFLMAVTRGGLISLWNSIFYTNISPERFEVQQNYLPKIIVGSLLTTLFLGLVTLLYNLYRKKVLGRSVFIGAFIVLAVLDLWRIDYKFIRVVPLRDFFQKDGAIEFLQRRATHESFRVLAAPGVYRNQDYLAYFGIPELLGYHGNQLKIYDEFTDRPLFEEATTMEEYQRLSIQFLMGPKIDLLSLKYLLAPYDFENTKYKAVRDFGRFKIYENRNFIPRVRLVDRYEVIPESQKALKRVAAASFDHRESVILEKAPPFPSAQELMLKGEARIVQDNINDLTVEAQLDHPGILILADNYYPAWKAYVDGEPTEIIRANYIHRAVFLPAGRHQVRFKFENRHYQTSLYISLLTIVGLVVIILGNGLRTRLRRAEHHSV